MAALAKETRYFVTGPTPPTHVIVIMLAGGSTEKRSESVAASF